MKNLSTTTKAYIIWVILIGLGLIGWTATEMDWSDPGLYLLTVLGAIAQTLKVEGPTNRTNYSIAWVVYGFAFLALGTAATVFVVVVSHLVEWAWHKYPWYIQSFNIGNHVLAVYLAGLVLVLFKGGNRPLDIRGVLGMVLASLVFVFTNHMLLGWVVKLARGQSFAESGVFEGLTLSLDFATLTLGMAAALAWVFDPFAAMITLLPLILLYQALRMPALRRQLQEMKQVNSQTNSMS